MGKVITSPVKHFAGTVTLTSPITLPLYLDWMEASEVSAGEGIKGKVDKLRPVICACIESADIQGFPEHPTSSTWPVVPAPSSLALLTWLVREVRLLVEEADEIPPA